jgi:hypothetical protein
MSDSIGGSLVKDVSSVPTPFEFAEAEDIIDLEFHGICLSFG